MGREGEVLSQLMPGFEREHPDIHVEVQQIPWTAAHEKLLTAYVGDATPDIAMLGNTWVPEFVALNALAPLDSFVDAVEGSSARRFLSRHLEDQRRQWQDVRHSVVRRHAADLLSHRSARQGRLQGIPEDVGRVDRRR